MRALVRLRCETAVTTSAVFTLGRVDAKQTGYRLLLTGRKDGDSIGCSVQRDNKPLHDAKAMAENLDWAPVADNSFTYYPRAYSLKDIRPGWADDFRVRIEHDMSGLHDVNDKWIAVRIELAEGLVRFWVDDRLVSQKRDPSIHADGLARVDLSPGMQLGACEINPWRESPGFLTIGLDGYANGREFMASNLKPGSLPASQVLGGVPFVFPSVTTEAKDHIDIGRSLYRQANMEGYLPSYGPRWIGASRRDPARIQLRIPNGTYDALHLIAAADADRDAVPRVTAMLYRPSAGFCQPFTAEVPLATAEGAATESLSVTLVNGKEVKLWLVKIPLDPSALASFSDLGIVEVELTKNVRQFRSYPDPFIYGTHQAGPPSSVHVFAATLREAPLKYELAADKFGHVWTTPEVPSYTATVSNRGVKNLSGKLVVIAKSYDGTETSRQEIAVMVSPGGQEQFKLRVPVKLNGYHDLSATLELPGRNWTEQRSFVRLAPDTRTARWTPGKGALFGFWSYFGGHYTPKPEHHISLMTAAGARTTTHVSQTDNPLVQKHWTRGSAGAWEVAPQRWAAELPLEKEKYDAYQKHVVEAFKKAREKLPPEYRPDHVYFFPEPHVSRRLSEGNYPEYWNGAPYEYTEEEKANLRMFMVTAQCAAETVRKEFPDLKVLIPWGDALFAVPLLRAGFPKNLIDGSGIDTPGFERLPEMQLHQIAIHRLYELKKEYAKYGMPNPQLQYTEGIFVPTEPGAVSWREQMDIYTRWSLISMAYGIDRFYSGWFAFDCGSYYGSEHYGGCGIQRRIPYCDPKPAYAAYATMTDHLNEANFDGWMSTGSLTNYCLRFKGPRGNVYTMWNIRGKRPVTLTLASDGEVSVTDSMNNTKVLKSQGKQITVATDPSVIYVTATAPVMNLVVGEPDHGDARPTSDAKQIADLGDGTWSFTSKRDEIYENGTFAVSRFPGKFTSSVVEDAQHGKVLQSELGQQETTHELMPWYNTLAPKKSIVLPGVPAAIGIWAKGASDWGRVIYTLRDAKGERWTSIGTQDQYNCDDMHSWSAFNFDGWRYLRFELPGHTGYDNFRKHGTTWWRGDGGDAIVDLPLSLESIIVEQRSHILYVNDVQPAASNQVSLGKVYIEYAMPDDALPEATRLARLRMPLPTGVPPLPNPIADFERDGVGEPVAITKLEPPISQNDGTLVHVHFDEQLAAAKHFVWVGIRPDGKGAVNLTPAGAKTGVLVRGLRPALPLHFWVTYQTADGKMSKPSKAATATLVDVFKEK